MTSIIPKSNQAIRNRAFHCRMRNRYYEEVYYSFRGLEPIILQENAGKNPPLWITNIESEINRCIRSLNTCLEYAEAAIFFGKNENINPFSKDKRWGILQEEILLVYFLKEIHATTRYFLSRIETDKKLQEWNDSLHQSIENGTNEQGFVSHLQTNMDSLNLSTVKEFKSVYIYIQERFETGNVLFGTIQELQRYY